MEVLMVAPEMVPYAKTGGLADVAGALSPALSELGVHVSAVVPCYRGIEQKYQPRPVSLEVGLPVLEDEAWRQKKGEILSTRVSENVEVYFVKMDEYFNRPALYTEAGEDYPDNCARFTFFCRAALELVRSGVVHADVVHAHDWQAALIPILLQTAEKDDPKLSRLKSVFTIHNLGYQGIFWHWDMKLMGIPWEYFTVDFLEYYGKLNLLKGAILAADAVTTVSEGYAREIQTPELGYGLDGIIRRRANDLYGILNGIDYSIWSPEKDLHLPARFSAADPAGKALCKAALQKELGLPVRPEVPIVAGISRLVDQKGFDLVSEILLPLLKQDLQFVLLGSGAREYEELFSMVARKNPERASVNIKFDDGLAHRIEAGSDMFLMPSLYEPCGLNQMISLKYGTVPVVRATGGLADTVTPWDPQTGAGNGFKFSEYRSEALWSCLTAALAAYRRPEEWRRIVQNGMKEDRSWTASAKRYLDLYRKVQPAA